MKEAEVPLGGSNFATTLATYSSEGVLHRLTRQESSSGPVVTFDYFYFAGRPVAQLRTENGSTKWSYLNADRLGAPIRASDTSGEQTWLGPFEPFGESDYLTATENDPYVAEMYLRFPGQWADASAGAEVSYNVHRWYERGTGRYTRVDCQRRTKMSHLWRVKMSHSTLG